MNRRGFGLMLIGGVCFSEFTRRLLSRQSKATIAKGDSHTIPGPIEWRGNPSDLPAGWEPVETGHVHGDWRDLLAEVRNPPNAFAHKRPAGLGGPHTHGDNN